jgi:hypothetical protein
MIDKNLKKYGQDFQYSLLSLFFQNKSFTKKIYDIIDPNYFDNKYTQWFCEKGLDYLDKYLNFPTSNKIFNVLKTIVEREVDETISKTYLNVLGKIKDAELSDRQYVEDEAFNFCFSKYALIQLELQKNHILLNNFGDARKVAFDTFVPVSQGNQEFSLKSDHEIVTKEKEHKNPVPLPFETFTKNTKGGPGAGDLAVIMAQSNFGKSNFLVAWARHCAQVGLNVIYFTLETHGEQLMDRAIAGLTGINQENLVNHKRMIESKVEREVRGDIRFIKIKSTQARTEVIRQKVEEKKANGFFPNFIIIDGLNQLKAPRSMNFNGNSNDKFEYLAEELRDMGDEYGLPVAVAFQSNRSGFNTEYADEQSIGKAIEVYQVCDLMIFFTQSIPMQEQGEAYAQLLKNRLGPKGLTLKVEYNPNLSTFIEKEIVNRSLLLDQSEKTQVKTTINKVRVKNLERVTNKENRGKDEKTTSCSN